MYQPRIYDQIIASRLEAKGAILIEGAKWCGKTTTCTQLANSILYLADPARKKQYLELARLSPQILLEGETPRLLDEWQLAVSLWDAVRFEVDQRGTFGQFLLTGSSVPANISELSHSGTGRIGRIRMRPMALCESGESSGTVRLSKIFEGHFTPAQSHLTLYDIAFLTCRGGWPTAAIAAADDEEVALMQAYDYVDAVCHSDISSVDGVARNPKLALAIMRSLARFTAASTSNRQILRDVTESYSSLSDKTLSEYLSALERSFVTEDLKSWNPNLRSKAAIRSTPVRHFTDPSIGVAALGADPHSLIQDLETFGLLFETLCIRDLRILADALNGSVSHYRDSDGLECDAVIHLRNGAYGLIEIKLGGDHHIAKGSKTLQRLASKLDTDKMGKPSFLMVLTAIGDFAYQRDDGVIVCPIGALGL